MLEAPWGTVGVMVDEDAWVPEVAREWMLRGADLVIWPYHTEADRALPVARARAFENRMFVVAAGRGPGTQSYMVDPGGIVVAQTLGDQELHVTETYLALALARIKDVVPGTNVLTGRRPETYGLLTTLPRAIFDAE